MNGIWVVFDGTEPDSVVIGLAPNIDGIIDVIDQTVDLDHSSLVIRLPYSDTARIEALASELGCLSGSTARAWCAAKHSVSGP